MPTLVELVNQLTELPIFQKNRKNIFHFFSKIIFHLFHQSAQTRGGLNFENFSQYVEPIQKTIKYMMPVIRSTQHRVYKAHRWMC